jgi:hypothetical protein
MTRLLLAACFAAAASVLAGAQQPPALTDPAAKDKSKTPPPVVIVVAADIDTLVKTFATNELRANELYVGKTVRVTGAVSRVTVNRGADPASGRDAYQVDLQSRGGGPADVDVSFSFDRPAKAVLAGLTAGTDVAIQGKCGTPTVIPAGGKDRPRDYIVVAVTDCTLTVVPPPDATLVIRR